MQVFGQLIIHVNSTTLLAKQLIDYNIGYNYLCKRIINIDHCFYLLVVGFFGGVNMIIDKDKLNEMKGHVCYIEEA
jgi:intracellular septation protein A